MWTIDLNAVCRLSILVAVTLPSCGCNRGIPTRVVHGTVKVGGGTPDIGYVRFVPIEGTPGPVNGARITDGQYRIEARGGVPLGIHRVEVITSRKTGRKVLQDDVPVDDFERFGPANYASANSPLKVQVSRDSDSCIDIQIPAQ